jgi:hypothetical protein
MLASGHDSRGRGAIIPVDASRRVSRGGHTCRTWCRVSVGPSMQVRGAWKSKAAKSRHETGGSLARSSPRQACRRRPPHFTTKSDGIWKIPCRLQINGGDDMATQLLAFRPRRMLCMAAIIGALFVLAGYRTQDCAEVPGPSKAIYRSKVFVDPQNQTGTVGERATAVGERATGQALRAEPLYSQGFYLPTQGSLSQVWTLP